MDVERSLLTEVHFKKSDDQLEDAFPTVPKKEDAMVLIRQHLQLLPELRIILLQVFTLPKD
ncbi:AFH_G0023160.mRNA.1.CDS.1 [Saccharomyces cerevisiae]|nr:AFH_G0023160.mRNA.1.CDS.1 [Saccharomyces cerevisiae]CAI6725163.1 AFH_G0023160.mRNA.1.CDS.1 [Saccharomyces cerevisiae]